MASQERFGYEWDKYDGIDPKYELQFSQWVAPLTHRDFEGKRVLDAGCGMGRNSYWALRWGARDLTAFDFDQRSVDAAKKNLALYKNSTVLFRDFFKVDFKDQFDVAFSIGVIHHLEDPELAIKKMTSAVVSGGKVVIWVYSYEGNEWIVRFVNPIRIHITSHLPLPLVHFLSYFASVPLYIVAKIFKGPGKYIQQLGEFKFWHVHSIVFDQLIPTIAHYWNKGEVQALFDMNDFSSVEIYRPPHDSGWTVVAVKK